jgi:hypothetical protein
MKRCGVGWLVTLGAVGFAMAVAAGPAQALEYGGSPWLVCADSKEAAEVGARYMPLEPANGATVPAGTPVTFSGESTHALTFNVASWEALVSSPDIDTGVGSQSGAFYRFTSTKATATPRTIYWTASFTFTPTDCESPSTFTTPIHALVVAPSEAELAAAKRQQEEADVKKNQEEEATAAKKKQEEEAAALAVTGSVSLDGSTIMVKGNGEALVKLACTGTGACGGRLSLMGKVPLGKGRRIRAKAKVETLGTAGFSIRPGETASVEVALSTEGRTLLGAARRQHVRAGLTIVKSSPVPVQTATENVRLVQVKAAKTKRR